MLTFLHLSDLHFITDDAGTQYDRDDEIRAALLDDLGKEERTNFDAILVTGDVAYHGRSSEFERASSWFAEICQKTNVPAESFFTIPGNHDVNQDHVKEGSIMWEAHKCLREMKDEVQREKNLEGKLKDNSWDFLHPLTEYRNFAAKHGRLATTSAQELAWACQLTSNLDDGTPVVLHGLNSAFLSNAGDTKANLLVSPFQFGHLRAMRDCVNLVMCHHPATWLIDGNHVEDRFRKHAHVVLTGHEHQTRCFSVNDGLRVCAGAVHPSRGEREWNPGYNVIRLSIEQRSQRTLITQVETRVWHKTEFIFHNSPASNGTKFIEHRQILPALAIAQKPLVHDTAPGSLSGSIPTTVTDQSDNTLTATFAAARRKLIIHFFDLGPLGRYEAAMTAGVWDNSDENLQGQALWARVFERAETMNKLAALWDAVAAKDETMSETTNPFTT
jgi:DNA repair exonuclease SbcCD nuclease subunit